MGERYWVWLIARLAIAVAVVGWAFSYLNSSGSGEKELQKSLEAIKQVRTVRVSTVADMTPTQHSEFTYELVCSQDAFHSKWHMVESDPAHPGEINNDNLTVAHIPYRRMPDGSWQKDRYGNSGDPEVTCKRLAQGDSNLLPDFRTMIQRGIIEKGDKKTVNGVRCREWRITLRGGTTGLEHDTVCLGLDDHLPYEMLGDSGRSRTLYTDYNNSSFQIELPPPDVLSAAATGN